ncbi:unnamed protein product, partial [Ectocarpus sp. 12 AP-2014]
QNCGRARSLVDKAEGDGAPMLRAARNHRMHDKRLQVLGSLSNNYLALVVSSPVITSAASSEGRRDGGVGANTSLAPKQTV